MPDNLLGASALARSALHEIFVVVRLIIDLSWFARVLLALDLAVDPAVDPAVDARLHRGVDDPRAEPARRRGEGAGVLRNLREEAVPVRRIRDLVGDRRHARSRLGDR